MKAETSHLVYIDILRLLACFLVVLTHSALPSVDGTDGLIKGGISFLGSPSSELFLALSGAVLLPVRKSMREFYHRRLKKLIPPVLCWSVAIILIYVCLGKITLAEGISALAMIPLKPVHGVYWFIYVMIGLYLIAPIISPWLASASKKQVQFVLALWGFNLLLPYVSFFAPPHQYVQMIDYQTHYWMLNSFGGFAGYYLLGYYLQRYPISIGMNVGWLATLLGIVGLLGFHIYLKIFNYDNAPFMDNLQIGSAILVIFLVTIVQHFSKSICIQRRAKVFSSLAKYSFGIYLIHILVVRDFVWIYFKDNRMSAIPETFAVAILSMIICYVILIALSYLPKSKYIIGC